MVPTGISEFTFGFAFLHEQTLFNQGNLRSAPILPSLQQEADDAWDARLQVRGADLYYQFKLTDYLFNHNAKFIGDGTYVGPYYRIALHKRDRNRQHRRLRRHCRRKPRTYYVAPEFNGFDAFNHGFLMRQISQQSRLISLRQCHDINDDDQHYITFQAGDPAWLQHSEPKRSSESFSGKDLGSILESTRESWRPIDLRYAQALYEDVVSDVEAEAHEEGARALDQVSGLLSPVLGDRSTRTYLRTAADLLSIAYGLTLVLVGEAPRGDPEERGEDGQVDRSRVG
jgi:hypothetical protein